MALFIILAILLFFLFLFVGALKGFYASSEARDLKIELVALRRKLNLLEKRLDSAPPQPEAAREESDDEQVGEKHVAAKEDAVAKTTTLPDKEELPDASDVRTPALSEDTKSRPEPGQQRRPRVHPKSGHAPRQRPQRKPRPKPKPRPKSKWAQQFEGMSWETILGTYIIPRLGVLGITIAVFIALALAVQSLGPAFRVVIGYGVSAALFGLGKFTERKYAGYAQVVYGAGLAVAYFVTFATHYIPFARVFDSPLPALGGMAVIVGLWAALAQRRKSPTIAMLVTALGHFTIGLTSVTVDNPGVYSVFGIVILSIGSAFFLLRNRWYYVAAVGMCASYINHFLLLANSSSSGTVSEFMIAMGVLVVYFLIYAFSELFAPEELRRKAVPGVVRSLFVSFNTGFVFLLGTLVMNGFAFSEDRQHLFEYALAAALLVLCALYYLRRRQDPMYNTYFAKAVTVATLGLAVQFDGHTLTSALAIETIALLFSSKRSGLVVTRLFAHCVGALTFAHGMLTFLTMQHVPYGDEAFRITLLQSVLPPVALLVASLAYQRIDWSTRMRVGFTMPVSLRTFLWQLDFHPEPAENARNPVKPLGGLFYPYVYGFAGGVLWLSYILRLIEVVDRFNLYGCIALGMLALAWWLRSKPFAGVSVLFTAATFIMTWHTMIEPKFGAAYVVGVVTLILIGLATERTWLPERDSLVFHRNAVAPFVFYGAAAWSTGLYLTYWFSDMEFLGALIVGSVLLSGLTQVLHQRAMATFATAYLLWAHAGWLIETVSILDSGPKQLSSGQNAIAVALIALSVGGDRFYTFRKLPVPACIFLCVAFVTSTRFAGMHVADSWYGFVLALIAAAFLAYATFLRSRTAAVLALGGTAFAALMQLQWAYEPGRDFALAPTVFGFASVIALLITFERAARLRFANALGNALGGVTGICVAVAAVLGVVMLERIPDLAAFYLTLSWSILALGYFAVAIGTGEKAYRFAGLGILSLAILRVVFVDTRELEAAARVFAFGGLGAVLLGIGLGYVKAFGTGIGSAPRSTSEPNPEASGIDEQEWDDGEERLDREDSE